MLEAIIGGGFSVVIFFLGYVVAEVRKVKADVIKIVEKEKKESVLAQRRIDTLDSTLSDITQEKFSSRSVVEHGTHPPKIHKKLMGMIHDPTE